MTGRERKKVDYDDVAETFDARYAYYAAPTEGVGRALSALARDVRARRVLEVGCGTGHWLTVLAASGFRLCGIDPSIGMLRKVPAPHPTVALVAGTANALPWRPGSFDLIFCVNALHHFDRPAEFVRGARALLAPGGTLAVIGMNPHARSDRWYVYDYFAGTHTADLARFPSAGDVVDWMIDARFGAIEWRVVERIRVTGVGRAMLADPMLRKTATSQLTLLSDDEYAAGVARIRAAIETAEATGEERAFPVDISLHMVAGRLPEGGNA